MDTPLRKARLRRDLTQDAVAKAADIKQSFYSRLENGDCTASPETAAKLAAFFGHEITELQILYPERYVTTGSVA